MIPVQAKYLSISLKMMPRKATAWHIWKPVPGPQVLVEQRVLF